MPTTWESRYLAWLIAVVLIVVAVLGLLHVVPFSDTTFWGVTLALSVALFFR